MRTAIIELIDKSNFRTDLVEQKNNREMVEWVNCVLEETDPSEYCIYECVQDFLDAVNDNRGVSADSACYMFNYFEYTGLHFIEKEGDAPMAQTKKPTIKEWFADMKAQHPERFILVRMGDFYETYGEDAEIASKVLGITCTKRRDKDGDVSAMAGFPYHALDTYLPKLIRAGHRVAICDEPGENVKVEVSKDEVKETPTEESKVEEKKNFPDHSYGRREFAEHARRIFDDGEAIFHTEVGGKRYIVRGLFDNEDLITHIYDEDTMELVDRRFEVGAQDGADNECEYLTDYFERKFVVDKHWSDSWCMNEKQFNFLKNA